MNKGHLRSDGYRAMHEKGTRNYKHILVAEKALGKKLPVGAEVHHINENKNDNRNCNLVICPDQKYHALLHLRMKAMAAGYPPHYRWCGRCKSFDDTANLRINYDGKRYFHKNCTSKSLIEFSGKKLTAADWARTLGITPAAMSYRLKSMPLEKALTTPRMRP